MASLTDLSSSLRARIPSGVENSTTTAVMQPVTYDFFNITAPVNRQSREPGDPCHTLARSNAEHAVVMQPVAFRETADCLTAAYGTKWNGNASADNGSLFAFHPTQDPISSSDVCHAIGANKNATAAVALRGRDGGATAELGDDAAFALRASSGGGDKPHVLAAMQVRRLTPVECERLQGFPDGYTAIPWRKKEASECPDGPRYKALGNSWAVPVVRWIGRRIAAATSSHPSSSQTS